MREKLLGFINCPKCSGSLVLKQVQNREEHVWTGKLVCERCDYVFPIVDGVPIFLVDFKPQNRKKYGYLFSLWFKNKFEEEKVYGSTEEEELEEFFTAYGISPSELKNKTVLDAGCGVGRLTKNLGKYAKEVVGFDMHEAMESVFQQSYMIENVHIIQADLFHPPFSKKFNFVWCQGVLPYTPNPREGFHKLSTHVKDGGMICAWFYIKGQRSVTRDLRNIFKNSYKLPPPILLLLCRALAFGYVTIASIIRRKNRFKRYKVLAFSFYDFLSQKYVYYLTIPEIRQMFEEEGLEILNVSESGQEFVGVKRCKQTIIEEK